MLAKKSIAIYSDIWYRRCRFAAAALLQSVADC
jgi:hypothetical protein